MTNTRQLVPAVLLLLVTSMAFAQAAPPEAVPEGPAVPAYVPNPTASPADASDPSAAPKAKRSENSAEATSNQSPERRDKANKDKGSGPLRADQAAHPVLWVDPGNIAARDLFYGQGARKNEPKPPFIFLQEDMEGTNPKFDVRDAEGKKWRVKLGEESRPEVVASRLLWAVGYFANDDYVLPEAQIQGLKMHRKSGNAKGETITFARFSRKPGGQEKIGIWDWRDNPFTGSREFNGMRVMMAVMNNWDLKDVNNSVYQDDKSDRQIFLANDVGATFGTNGLSWTRARSKGNIDTFKGSKFLTRITDSEVDFATPAAPKALLAETVGLGVLQYKERASLDWIGNNIPREDARWIASLLAQLTHRQLTDAFRAGGFPSDEIEMYVTLVENRIAELKAL